MNTTPFVEKLPRPARISARIISIQVVSVAALVMASSRLHAATVYTQPPIASGTLYQSSWLAPDDSDYDQYIWDSFTLTTNEAITEVRWRGGFDPAYFGMGGPIVDFTVAICANSSNLALVQPDVVNPPLVEYTTGGNAGQSAAGSFGGVAMYDYSFVLPAPFQATAGTRYWVYILAWQHGIPDWGLASGSGGNGSHFRYLRGAHMYQNISGDTCFSLLTSNAPTFLIAASASPTQAGTIQGVGSYPSGSTASLVAFANSGYGFVNWTENGTQVSTSATYNFVVNANRTLVANFTSAYTISTAALPTFGGTTTGGGIFNSGSSVTVEAAANPGFVFVDWTEYGAQVSTTATYTFTAAANRPLTANFATDPLSVAFDFDNAPVHTSLPVSVSVDGLGANLSATDGGFSIQFANAIGFTPAGFSGLCIYPNTVFRADLIVDFTETLTDFSIMYCPQELGCDNSATMLVTAYMDGAVVGTNTATVPFPGTYPTGTLSITVPAGFNRAVVHHAAPPPTCQDWGPIFLADNMVVSRKCLSAAVEQQPLSTSVCASSPASFFVIAAAADPVSYQWMHDNVAIDTIANPTAASDLLFISSATAADEGEYRCAITSSCGNAISDAAMLSVTQVGTGDGDGSGLVDGGDIQQFVESILIGSATEPPPCANDMNSDGFVDFIDMEMFVIQLLAQ